MNLLIRIILRSEKLKLRTETFFVCPLRTEKLWPLATIACMCAQCTAHTQTSKYCKQLELGMCKKKSVKD